MIARSTPSSSKIQAAAAVAAITFGALAAAQQPAATPAAERQASFLAEHLQTITATVTALDAAKRLVTLKAADGREVTVEAGPAVRNFAQLEVGDKVNVDYYLSLAADLTKAPQSNTQDAVVITSRAAEGASPAGGAGVIYTAIVTVDSIDTASSTVSFTGPEGRQREVTAERDAGRAFIAQLKPGDRVQVTYTEALAVAVAPAK